MYVDATSVSFKFLPKTLYILQYIIGHILCGMIYIYVYVHTCLLCIYIYIQLHTSYIYTIHIHTHSLPFFCVISHVYIVVHFYDALFDVFYRDIMALAGPMRAPWQEWTNFLDAALVILGLVDFGFSLQADGGSLRKRMDSMVIFWGVFLKGHFKENKKWHNC